VPQTLERRRRENEAGRLVCVPVTSSLPFWRVEPPSKTQNGGSLGWSWSVSRSFRNLRFCEPHDTLVSWVPPEGPRAGPSSYRREHDREKLPLALPPWPPTCGVPRSGMIFQKRGDALFLIRRLPPRLVAKAGTGISLYSRGGTLFAFNSAGAARSEKGTASGAIYERGARIGSRPISSRQNEADASAPQSRPHGSLALCYTAGAFSRVGPAVPSFNGAGAVLAFGDDSLEILVRIGMLFDLHGEDACPPAFSAAPSARPSSWARGPARGNRDNAACHALAAGPGQRQSRGVAYRSSSRHSLSVSGRGSAVLRFSIITRSIPPILAPSVLRTGVPATRSLAIRLCHSWVVVRMVASTKLVHLMRKRPASPKQVIRRKNCDDRGLLGTPIFRGRRL
jgi:hypothetical protein